MSPSEAAELRRVIDEDHARTSARLAHLTGDFDGIVEASEMVALDDEHDPEGATVAFERAQVAALLDAARDQLRELDLALGRLTDGTYGRCERCGLPIAVERLMAQPVARTCVACAAAGANVPLA